MAMALKFSIIKGNIVTIVLPIDKMSSHFTELSLQLHYVFRVKNHEGTPTNLWQPFTEKQY